MEVGIGKVRGGACVEQSEVGAERSREGRKVEDEKKVKASLEAGDGGGRAGW